MSAFSREDDTPDRLRLFKAVREMKKQNSENASPPQEQKGADAPLSPKRSTFKDFLKQQEEGMSALSSVGVIGLHMVSGPLVGFGIGYGLDSLAGTHPWGKIFFLLIGIAAGFLNVYRDSQILLRRIAQRDRAAREGRSDLRSKPADIKE